MSVHLHAPKISSFAVSDFFASFPERQECFALEVPSSVNQKRECISAQISFGTQRHQVGLNLQGPWERELAMPLRELRGRLEMHHANAPLG
jgi:hypothetical protein